MQEDWIDLEKDGSPGMTILLRGIITSDISAIQEDHIAFEANPTEAGQLKGHVEWEWKRRILGSTNPSVSKLPVERPVTTLLSRPFTLSKSTSGCTE